MTAMCLTALVALFFCMIMGLVRAALGPTVFDRILALNMFGTLTVVVIAAASFLIERADFIDLALVYALMNFIGVVAVLRFSKYGFFTRDAPSLDEERSR